MQRRSRILAIYALFCITTCGPPTASLDSAPRVTAIEALERLDARLVSVRFTLVDREEDPASVTVEFADTTGTFRPMPETPGGDGTRDLTTRRSGQSHRFLWDLDATSPRPADASAVQVRITPRDTVLLGAPFLSPPLTLPPPPSTP